MAYVCTMRIKGPSATMHSMYIHTLYMQRISTMRTGVMGIYHPQESSRGHTNFPRVVTPITPIRKIDIRLILQY